MDIKYNMTQGKRCVVCNKPITDIATRCRVCNMIKNGKRSRYDNNNPRYKRGLSAGYVQRIARESVIKDLRSIELCEKCGNYHKPSHFMIIHHKDRNRANNNPENLIVLCSKCHTKEHTLLRKIKKICNFCGIEYIGEPQQKYCSKKCYGKHYRNNHNEEIKEYIRQWKTKKRK